MNKSCCFTGQKRILKYRKEMIKKREADWAMGEAFAFGSLLMEGGGREGTLLFYFLNRHTRPFVWSRCRERYF